MQPSLRYVLMWFVSWKIMEWQKGDKDLEGHEMVDDLGS
jgi:hypothetical protein